MKRIEDDEDEGKWSLVEKLLITVATLITVALFPLTAWWCVVRLSRYQRGVLLRFGRVRSAPTGAFRLPGIDALRVVDVRQRVLELPPMQLLTLEGATLKASLALHYSIVDPVRSVCVAADDPHHVMGLIAPGAIRRVAARRSTLELLLADRRERLEEETVEEVNSSARDWGVRVARVVVTDVRVPSLLMDATARVHVARHYQESQQRSALAEIGIAATLKKSGDEVGGGEFLMRYLESMRKLRPIEHDCRVVILPIPTAVT